MKTLLSFILILTALPSLAAKKGEILLEGKRLNLEIGRTTIKLGGDEFRVVEASAEQIQGNLVVKVNGRTTVDKSVFVFTAPALVEEFRANPAAFNLTNLNEVKCPRSMNAFVLLGDNLNAPYPMVGNCLKL